MGKRSSRGNAGKGRPRGSRNRTTRAFKEACLLVFEARGGIEAFLTWSNRNPTEFYKICARLIPHEVSGPDGGPIPIAKIIDEHVER
jgi:hypothetical protein